MSTLLTMPSPSGRRIASCVPYYRCRRYLRRAVEGLLAQTHRDIIVIVVNDGDPESPWPCLADIRDPRLVRFDLAGNYGPYFATAVVLNATSAPYLLIQDADDWSPPNRAARLLDQLVRDDSDLAISAQLHYRETGNGPKQIAMRWNSFSMDGRAGRSFVIRSTLTPEFVYRLPHHGLFRSDAVRRVGGYYGGFRVSYDALLTNLILMTGRISHVRQPLYHHMMRPGSLTRSAATGMQSRFRRETEKAIAAMYKQCFGFYSDYLQRKADSQNFTDAIRACVSGNISGDVARRLAMETERLHGVLVHSAIEPSGRKSHQLAN